MVRPTLVRFLAVLAILLSSQTAVARPVEIAVQPPPPDEYHEPRDWRDDRAFFEWSSWARLGFGVERVPVDAIARTIEPPQQLHDQQTHWDAALGADVTFPFPTRKVRLGPWLELRPQGVFTGAEVTIAGKELDMFWFNGERVWTVRAGASTTDVTGAFAFGYRCPWKLWGPWNDATRYMIGVRLVASGTRAVADPNDWAMSLGLELEPIGALRYVGGIKSWY